MEKTNCGPEPKFENYTIGKDGFSLHPFEECFWANSFINLNGKLYIVDYFFSLSRSRYFFPPSHFLCATNFFFSIAFHLFFKFFFFSPSLNATTTRAPSRVKNLKKKRVQRKKK
jgi:hypothetical protein